MATSTLEKEQRSALQRRLNAAKRDWCNRFKQGPVPPAVRMAQRLVSRYRQAAFKRESRFEARINRAHDKLYSKLLFTEPAKMLARIEQFEKTGR